MYNFTPTESVSYLFMFQGYLSLNNNQVLPYYFIYVDVHVLHTILFKEEKNIMQQIFVQINLIKYYAAKICTNKSTKYNGHK